MMDYFNPSCIALGNKLDYTSNSGYNLLLQYVADEVNDAGTYDTYLTVDNVTDFLSTFANYEVADDSSEADIKNNEIAQSFFDTLDLLRTSITQRADEEEEEVEQYPQASATIDKIKFQVRYNSKLSNKDLVVMDLVITNKTTKKIKIDLTKFELRSDNNSTYPANNETLIRSYDSMFDFDKYLKDTATVNGKEYKTYRLYFVVSNSSEKLDCYYNSNPIGTVISY
jgi:hypothetical protein